MKRKLARETTKAVVKGLGAKETLNSGAIGQDNDFRLELTYPICWDTWTEVSGESKFTEKNSFSVSKQLLHRISKEAKSKLPVLQIGFVENRKSECYIVMKQDDFKSILEFIKDLQTSMEDNYFELDEP